MKMGIHCWPSSYPDFFVCCVYSERPRAVKCRPRLIETKWQSWKRNKLATSTAKQQVDDAVDELTARYYDGSIIHGDKMQRLALPFTISTVVLESEITCMITGGGGGGGRGQDWLYSCSYLVQVKLMPLQR